MKVAEVGSYMLVGGLARLIEVNCPEGREKALAYTKLEECVMWANAGIAKED